MQSLLKDLSLWKKRLEKAHLGAEDSWSFQAVLAQGMRGGVRKWVFHLSL